MESTSKIALITGSSRGLGKNMALTLARKGTDVIVTYRSKEQEAYDVVSEIEAMGRKAIALQLDTSNVKSFDAFFSTLSVSLNQKWDVIPLIF
jgi:NAD(P)-dependent dehydrogenase (short-subunit alcohol dehydrogenase family)